MILESNGKSWIDVDTHNRHIQDVRHKYFNWRQHWRKRWQLHYDNLNRQRAEARAETMGVRERLSTVLGCSTVYPYAEIHSLKEQLKEARGKNIELMQQTCELSKKLSDAETRVFEVLGMRVNGMCAALGAGFGATLLVPKEEPCPIPSGGYLQDRIHCLEKQLADKTFECNRAYNEIATCFQALRSAKSWR